MAPTILVVEDDASQRELLCELLEAHGYTCIAAEDGRCALDVIDRAPTPDAVVLDMVLPRLNGHEFLRELGERGERRLGVVVVSGFGPVSRLAERWPLVRAFVQKPVDLDALLAAVRRCVRAEPNPEPAR
ncbi:MAG TPA: response regulator [Myxococcaceae bacterium]|jgi:two-component system phosphate regulon response regulator PhoB